MKPENNISEIFWEENIFTTEISHEDKQWNKIVNIFRILGILYKSNTNA